MRLKKLFAVVLTSILALSTSAIPAFASSPTPGSDDQYSGVGSYMAFFQCQTTNWVYRNQFNDASAGYGTDIFKSIYNNETTAATSTVINDAVIDGDGEYTISLSELSLEGSTDWNMVGISTNIPLDSEIKITDATLKYDTQTITSKGVQKSDDDKFNFIMLINQYDPDMKDSVKTLVPADGSNITITFKVEGFGYAKKTTDAATTSTVSVTPTTGADQAATAVDATAEDTDSSSSTGLIIGIIAGVVVVGVIIVIVVSSKKKKNK